MIDVQVVKLDEFEDVVIIDNVVVASIRYPDSLHRFSKTEETRDLLRRRITCNDDSDDS